MPKGWEAHARALIGWLPLTAVVAVSVLHPASGVLSDSLADAGVVGAVVPVWAYAVSAVVEYFFVDEQWIGLAVLIPFSLTVFTTIDQPLLAESNACGAYCFVHLFALGFYTCAELGGLYYRGYAVRELVPYAAALVALGIYYRVVVAADDFDASDSDTLWRLRLVGGLEIASFAIARALISAS